jgi:SAM-dependent methyltransferase
MDELSIQDNRLTSALANLRTINIALGGFSTSLIALEPHMLSRSQSGRLNLLDVGCGGGDFAEMIVRWADKKAPGLDLRVTAIDYSPATVEWAGEQIKARLPLRLSSRIEFHCCDVFHLPFEDNAFDIAHASLFTHHFHADDIVRIFRQLNQVSRRGIVVNDLHRHAIAYSSILLLTKALGASAMVQHDGPLSVSRAFSRDEIARCAEVSGIGDYSLTWHWAFRWLLSTVPNENV